MHVIGILIQINGPTDDMSTFGKLIAWHLTAAKISHKTMMTEIIHSYRSRWVDTVYDNEVTKLFKLYI